MHRHRASVRIRHSEKQASNALFDFGHKFSTYLTDAVIKVSEIDSNSDAETTISKAIIKSMVYKRKFFIYITIYFMF